MPLRSRLKSVAYPVIRTEHERSIYVIRVTVLCCVLAVALDVVNQLIFFIDWVTSFRSWVISAFVASIIAAPVAWAIARAHLELYRAKLAMEKLSRTDPLTGLLNRRALLEELNRMPPPVMALVIADVDRFKAVNDAHGHLVGDQVICMVARAIESELGRYGQVGRIGGEEFALVSSTPVSDQLMSRLWDFRDRVAATPIVAGSTSVWVTISIGVARRKQGQTFTELFADADRALYLAKASGRNRVVSSDDMHSQDIAAAAEAPEPRSGERKYRSAG